MSQNTFDVIYIDGEHFARNALEDAVLAWPLLKVGGYMIWDDYAWEQHGGKDCLNPSTAYRCPRPGVDAFLELYKLCLTVVRKGYQVYIKRTAGPNNHSC